MRGNSLPQAKSSLVEMLKFDGAPDGKTVPLLRFVADDDLTLVDCLRLKFGKHFVPPTIIWETPDCLAMCCSGTDNKNKVIWGKSQDNVNFVYVKMWWTWRESNSRLRNANAAFYHLTTGPIKGASAPFYINICSGSLCNRNICIWRFFSKRISSRQLSFF